MTAGRLAASKPAATTNTALYRVDIDSTASTVLTATNQSGSATSYRAAIRDYDQILTLNGDEPSQYLFQKGNPISNYKLKISPGISFTDATPGADIESVNGSVAKLLDVFKDTATVNRYVKVTNILPLPVNLATIIGIFEIGETITGQQSSVAATLHAYNDTLGEMYLNIPAVSNVATAIQVSRDAGLADNTLMMLSVDATAPGTEIIQINAGGINTNTNTLTVTRGVYGTTASAIPAGQFAKTFIDSATVTTINEGATFAGGDTTLTVTDSTGFLEGGFIRIDNEILKIDGIAGNDLTVVRGQYGTADINHADGATITQLTDSGDYYLNWFSELETVEGSNSLATVEVAFIQGSSSIDNADKFVIAEGSVSNPYEYPLQSRLDNERTYRYWQEDSSNTGHPFRLSEDDDGTQGLIGTEYTTGVTKVGTPGQAGAYLEIVITENTPLTLYAYAEPAVPNTADSNAGFGHVINVSLDPAYDEIFVYKLSGATFTAADQFTIGATTYTIQANGVTPGKWGYVHDWDPDRNVLKVSIDIGSEPFAVGDEFYDTPTLVNGNRQMVEVVAGKIVDFTNVSAADALRVAGTYPDLPASGGTGSGAVVTVVVNGSGAATVTLVNGGKDYTASDTLTVFDAQLGGGGAANLTFQVNSIGTGDKIGATSLTYVNDEDYIAYDKALAANSADRTTGIVVGPGQNLLVYSGASTVNYVVDGFESASDDYVPILNVKDQVGAGLPTP
ncbi:structural protein [Synechococcus phage S-SZBM1]|uniref:Structural protein n=1 Tax=Synechococcus phage S-SZBM1 TaxID=2926475 RepID=A0AC61TSF1_9CAUD|nr:structural protein [Synechococcus phage S-SZBM1]UNH61170.1 structural protein [Synechococcus phage S-SZBM1]